MNWRAILSLAALVTALGAVAACQSPTELEQKAPTWTAIYNVPYDVLASCIAERERGPLATVTPSINSARRRATVAVTTPTGSAVGVYEIRQISGGTEVAYRSIFGGPTTDAGGGAYQKAKQCGNAA
jgi:hypothetical protein